MRIRNLLCLACLLAVPAAPARAVDFFSEDFSDNAAGWTLGPEWAIGPTSVSPTGSYNPDPEFDHSATADNGVGGTVLGGNLSSALHGYYYFQSPAVDLSGVTGTVNLAFWRWLNLDYTPYMHGRVEVFNGNSWVTVFQTGGAPAVTDAAWTFVTYDVTPHKNANFRVRFAHQVTSGGALTVSGWNIDDLSIASPCNDDVDGDTYIGASCGGNDCNDSNPAINPGATETCNGVDDDCDGELDDGFSLLAWFPDGDGDGYGVCCSPIQACAAPPGHVATADDCDDANPAIHPGAAEVCNNADDNCNGQLNEGFPRYWPDQDGDGYGNGFGTTVCVPTAGHVADSTDCNDSNAAVNPGATEVCNHVDDDCDFSADEGLPRYWLDADADGYGSDYGYPFNYLCAPDPAYAPNNQDCNDNNALIHPGVPESCNGVDEDCDLLVDEGCRYLTFETLRDVGNDQGRQLRLTWVRAALDTAAGDAVASYSVWRRIAPGMAPARSVGARVEPDAAVQPEHRALAFPPGAWDFVAYLPAFGLQRYTMVAPTLCDSNAAALCWSVFLVRAHMSSPFVFEDSPLDSGYSVDNIVPGVPQNLTATIVAGGRQIDWSDSPDSDFQYYRVYRGTDPGFVPGPGNFVHSTAASGWMDPSFSPALYKVTTVDANGNESAPAATALVTGVEASGGARALAFGAVSPNPFRGELTCAILVPASGADVTLRVLDLAGRTVRTLASSRLQAGGHSLTWDGRDAGGRRVAPGVYLLRLSGGGVAQVRRVSYTP